MIDFLKNSDDRIHPQQLNPMVLAYIGDGVYELFVRTLVIQTGGKVNTMHKQSVDYVKAASQALALSAIADELTQNEAGIVRRARNNKSLSVPKNSSYIEYRQATGFEALLGYLYLSKNQDRLKYIMTQSVKAINSNIMKGRK